MGGLTDLPAGFIGESADLHAMRSAARPGGGVAIIVESTRFTVAVASGELDRQALTHEVGSIFEEVISQEQQRLETGGVRRRASTRTEG